MKPLYPSTRSYKERKALEEEDLYAYRMMYTATHGSGSVWNRLCGDATVRQVNAPPAFKEGATARFHKGTNSGFQTNTTSPSATYTHNTFKNGAYDATNLDRLHPITLQKFHKKYPVDYFAAARPETETTNQTLRMWNTYDSDPPQASRLRAHVPHMCPGGKPSFHPDVTTARFGLQPTLPRRGMGLTLQDGRNLK